MPRFKNRVSEETAPAESAGAASTSVQSLGPELLSALPTYLLGGVATTVLTACFARWMSPDAFGGYGFSLHAVRLVAVFAGLGLGRAALRFLPRYQQQGAQALIGGFLLFSGAMVLLASGVGGLVLALLGQHVLDGGHSADALLHALWVVPVVAVNLWLARIGRSRGRLRLSGLATGALRDVLVLGVAALLVTLGLSSGRWGDAEGSLHGDEGLIAVGIAAGMALVIQLSVLFRDLRPEGRPRFEPVTWLRAGLGLGLLDFLAILSLAGQFAILRWRLGEAAVGGFHLAFAWAGWAAVAGLAMHAVLGRRVAGLARSQLRHLLGQGLAHASVAALGLGMIAFAVAYRSLDLPDDTHRLAEAVLLPLFIARALEGLGSLVGAGLAVHGQVRSIIALSSTMTLLTLACFAFLAPAGLVAAAWGLAALRALGLVLVLGLLRRTPQPKRPSM